MQHLLVQLCAFQLKHKHVLQNVPTEGLGGVGFAFPQHRPAGKLPAEATSFLEMLFERGEEDSSQKV